jgi:carboxyl-terminal processing protease
MNRSAAPIDRKSLLVSVVLIIVMVICAGGMSVCVLFDPGLKDAYVMTRVALQIQRLYPEGIDSRRLLTAAREAMFERLDRYSSYVDDHYFDQMDEELTGSYYGIGITVVRDESGLMVMSVRENGPAGRVGLLSGDIIIAADSVNLAGMSSSESATLLRGPEGTQVLITFIRPAVADTVEISITRERIPLMHIPFAGFTPDSVIYIRLLDFEAGATDDLRAALDSLIADTTRPAPQGLILDLRGNPGGLLLEAYRTADLFLTDGAMIVGTTGRSRWDSRKYLASGTDIADGLPMAVVVDRGSASSSEIVAGALQQAGRAVLVGDTTFGKGLVQGFVRFPDGGGLRLTVSRYYVGDGIYLNAFDSVLNDTGQGLAPDYCFNSVYRSGFALALENSLLLPEFANLYDDDIVAAADSGQLSDKWIERFSRYARSRDFTYRSRSTQVVALIAELARLEESGPDVHGLVDRMLDRSQGDDDRQYAVNGDYIKSRLKQIAIERRYGTYEAYRQVLVKEQPVIRFASEILRERK